MAQRSFKNVKQFTINQMHKVLINCKVINNKTNPITYKPTKLTTINIYTNNTVLIQGENIDYYIKKFNLDTISKNEVEINLPNFNNYSVLGCDEVGVGDFFGPIVTCCAFIPKNWSVEHSFLASQIKDSKKINNFEIVELYYEVVKSVKYSVYVMGNKTYNQKYLKYENINTLKVLAHNLALNNFSEKNPNLEIDYIVMDQFVEKKLYYNHLSKINSNKAPYDIFFTKKAEDKSLAVACASIIARFYFLSSIQKIEEKLGFKVYLGANNHVKKLVNLIKANPNINQEEFIKLNFNSEISKK